jgi:hypothetical protein
VELAELAEAEAAEVVLLVVEGSEVVVPFEVDEVLPLLFALSPVGRVHEERITNEKTISGR